MHSRNPNLYNKFILAKKLDSVTQFCCKYTVGTVCLKLFKIGAVIIRNTRSIKFLLSSSYPYQHIWDSVMKKLAIE
ncbi:transposase [Candidatus Tisiphia endosymbiont of Mystacides longicornis]|uniref:transposase n=1 Tax=Candidatus Tisiphia endosymbiont of Mystacides longicornis TaxID=3139330 RepID=UPI003CCB50D2